MATPPTVSSETELTTQLRTLAHDLLWTWREPIRRPFAMLDPALWEATRHNPVAMLRDVDPERLRLTFADPSFREAVSDAVADRTRELERTTWWDGRKSDDEAAFQVAYFCSEYAMHESMQQYSGGLGVLAADHVKSASDLGVPLVGVGLLYRCGYYVQELDRDGRTRVLKPDYDFTRFPVQDSGVDVVVPIDGRDVTARIWTLVAGRSRLLLLDADRETNDDVDRALTHALYELHGRDRLRQQVLLGAGGVRALAALGIDATVIHLNEGHAGFAALERLATRVEAGNSLDEAIEATRGETVFTTHTPVPAGHDRYDAVDAATILAPWLERATLDVDRFLELGRERPGDRDAPFCMTALALRLAARSNGVARLHGAVSRRMWIDLFPGARSEDDVPIGAVTNGVHVPTWMDPVARRFWEDRIDLPPAPLDPTEAAWARAPEVDPVAFWALRRTLRSRLVRFVRERLVRQARRRGATPEQVAAAGDALREDALTLCFARRFATYKRAPLLFRDVDRIARLLADDERPVQVIYAGKAHPADEPGRAFARAIHQFAHDPRFAGRVALVEEYDLEVGRMLVSGADVWLNTPLRPHEASGTSGMKPPLHGGLNCSILDGWWPEGFDGENGWAVGDGSEPTDHEAATLDQHDERDARALLELLEDEIVPLFHDRDARGVPPGWIRRALRSAATVPRAFSTDRMVAEYTLDRYRPAHAARA